MRKERALEGRKVGSLPEERRDGLFFEAAMNKPNVGWVCCFGFFGML